MKTNIFFEYNGNAYMLDKKSWGIFRLSAPESAEEIDDYELVGKIFCRGKRISEKEAMWIASKEQENT